jgi:hypothetical protein
MVARLDLDSVSLAQKPKSAGGVKVSQGVPDFRKRENLERKRTDLDVAAGVEKNVVALDIAVDDVLRVEVLEALAGLFSS